MLEHHCAFFLDLLIIQEDLVDHLLEELLAFLLISLCLDELRQLSDYLQGSGGFELTASFWMDVVSRFISKRHRSSSHMSSGVDNWFSSRSVYRQGLGVSKESLPSAFGRRMPTH